MEIYHNPRCSKSRESLNYLEKNGHIPNIHLYLNDGLSKKEIMNILKKSGLKISEIIRKEEAIFKENFKGKDLTQKEWIEALIKYPKLLQRPIIILDDKAVIGRPLQNVIDLVS